MSLGFYVGILADEPRIEGARNSLASVVQPGDKVLEVGTGLGTFAFFAAQAGAEHVWAVDRDPVIHMAEMLSRTNGFHDKITFLWGEMSEIELPGQVDLVVFEDFAVRLLDDRTWRLMRDAHDEHLRPGGRVLPEHVRLNLSLAGGSEVEALLALGDDKPLSAFGLDWSCLRPYLANSPRRASISPEALVGTPHVGPEMSLATLPTAEQLGLWRPSGRWMRMRPSTRSPCGSMFSSPRMTGTRTHRGASRRCGVKRFCPSFRRSRSALGSACGPE